MNINKYILIAIAILMISFIGWREYSHYSEKKTMAQSYKSVISFNEVEKNQLKNSLDLKVADEFVMKQNLVTEKIAKEELKEELKGYKDLTAYMKSEVITSIKNLEAKYDSKDSDPFIGIDLLDGDYIHKDDVDKNFVRVPKSFSYNDEWLSFKGTVNRESALLDSLYLLNKFDATIGYVRPDTSFSWFRKKEPVVTLKSYNPYTKIVYVNNVVVNDDKGKVGNILLSKPAMLIYGAVAGKIFLN